MIAIRARAGIPPEIVLRSTAVLVKVNAPNPKQLRV
jgi:hypothetical protein